MDFCHERRAVEVGSQVGFRGFWKRLVAALPALMRGQSGELKPKSIET